MTTFLKNSFGVDEQTAQKSKKRSVLVLLTSIMLLVDVVAVAVGSEGHGGKTLSNSLKSVCSQTRFPERCVSSLATYETATLDNMMGLVMKESMERAQHAHEFAMSLSNNIMNEKERAAWQDCVQLFHNTMDRLNVCLTHDSVKKDIPTWLSAALTNQDTCLNGFRDFNLTTSSNIKSLLSSRVLNVSELLSNSLSMYKLSSRSADSLKNRRLLSLEREEEFHSHYGRIEKDGFPEWLSAADRRLLQSSSPASQANVVVAQDGSANYRTITQAVNAAPQKSSKRYVIYVKAGIYNENVDISKTMTNLMFIGDGMDRTVVTGNKNVQDGSTTFQSATFGNNLKLVFPYIVAINFVYIIHVFLCTILNLCISCPSDLKRQTNCFCVAAVSGNGFIARDMTFENTAGAQKHQAVALRVGADLSVVYRCSIKGYQDTLYVYSLRQFYREVDIYGTVDFIFGNAAVVIQNSNILARRPMSQQTNTITAQGRTDPNQNTGISIHNCRVSAASDLQAVKGSVKTYLGRPWKQYSRTVFMQSALDDLIDPAGWLEWDGNFALQTLYYGEYTNTGVGARTSNRVSWPGFHVITSATEAARFTVGQFISGNSWIPATGVAFTSGLN